MNELPAAARAVVIGGGIVGVSTAYHLAQLGWKDVILLERHKLTSGSTFHAAGLVGQLRSSASITKLIGQSVALYARLEAETGLTSGWKQSGGLRLATTEARWAELKREAARAKSFGLEMQVLDRAGAEGLWPLMEGADVIGATFAPTDGQISPSDVTQSLAKGARMQGVAIIEEIAVTGIEMNNGRVSGINTKKGRISSETVIVCAGQWSRELCAPIGVSVPLVSVEHQYLITEAIPGIPANLPTLRDPDRLTYYKEEVGGLVMGGYEPNPIPWAIDGIPADFNFQLLDSNWDHFQPIMERAIVRVPALATAGVKTLLNGPESFTPDGNFILGAAPELAGLYVGAGFNAFGIAAGGGAGKALAEWVVGDEPPYDLSMVDIRRFGPEYRDVARVRAETLQAYARHYAVT